MSDCLFCKIACGDVPSEQVYSDDRIVAFRDINPQAPHHIQIIPREHISTIQELTEENSVLIGQMVLIANRLARELKIADDGYRLVWNCNRDGGQEVYHIHLHLLGGRVMNWPPG